MWHNRDWPENELLACSSASLEWGKDKFGGGRRQIKQGIYFLTCFYTVGVFHLK